MSAKRSASDLDTQNAQFWNEVCGSSLARLLGIEGSAGEALARFDTAYLATYPYLRQYLDRRDSSAGRVLELGPGYGTLGQLLAARGWNYHGLDLAEEPLRIMRVRLERLGLDPRGRLFRGSALKLPFANAAFDTVISIGCLHHCGDVPSAVSELRRILAPGGRAIVMLYNQWSFRRAIAAPLTYVLGGAWRRRSFGEYLRSRYDRNAAGDAAPHTDFVARRAARRLFQGFSDISIECQNFDEYALLGGRVLLPRRWFLGNLAKVVGLDLYVEVTR